MVYQLQPLVSKFIYLLFLHHNNTSPTPASVETSHLLPDILLAVVSLHPAEIPAAVIAAHCKKLLTQNTDPDGVPADREAGHQGPGVSAGVISLHAAKPALSWVTHCWGVMTTLKRVTLITPLSKFYFH